MAQNRFIRSQCICWFPLLHSRDAKVANRSQLLQLWGVQCTKELFVSLLQRFAQTKFLVCAFMKGCEKEPTKRLIQRLYH